jgi:putative CocE/NonD family hydrolase
MSKIEGPDRWWAPRSLDRGLAPTRASGRTWCSVPAGREGRRKDLEMKNNGPAMPGPGPNVITRALGRAWSLPPRQNRVAVARNVSVPMSDGTTLQADHYFPITDRQAATVLVRTPYGRRLPFSLDCHLIAERGFHVLVQSCRGTFGSGGEFDPMRHEAADAQDTVAWLRQQHWFDGRLATYGASYLGFVQWALAADPPPELRAAVVLVGPHDFSQAAYHHGAFDLQNFLGWSDMVAHQETTRALTGLWRMATTDRRLRPALNGLPVTASARDLLGTGAPWFEGWLAHPDVTDPFWAPLQCGAALQRTTVPTLLVGGWQDLFLAQTLEQYRVLSGRGVPTRLLVGPWTHLDVGMKGGVPVAESLGWLDRYLGPGAQAAEGPGGTPENSVRVWVGGAPAPGWRDVSGWPPAGSREQRWYPGPHGTLSPQPASSPGIARFRYDPADPTPSVGGAVMTLNAGVRDNRAVEQRADVLVFSSEPLDEPVEILGEVAAELSVARDNPHADLFVRLCDVDEKGRSRNVCDGIVRLTGPDPDDGVVRVSLIGAGHRFAPGHRIRLQVAGGAHPRFARNPGNGRIEAPARDLVPTGYQIDLASSALMMPVTK